MKHWLARLHCRPTVGQIFEVDGQKYVLKGKLGDGAVGLVRKALHEASGRTVAVKFLAPDPKYIDTEKFDDVAARFRREGIRGAGLDHPFLVKTYAYSENKDGGSFQASSPQNPFLLMQLMPGKTLESLIRNSRPQEQGHILVTRQRLALAIQLTSALAYLHQNKLIHRDVKPANVFLSRSESEPWQTRARLGDFGVVKWGEFQASVATGSITVTTQKGLGTMKYMSPEQAIEPKQLTVRSDIFSLGITLLELFAGSVLQTPHHVFRVMATRTKRGTTQSRLMSLDMSVSSEDAGLAELILDMFSGSPDERPSSSKIEARLVFEYEQRFEADWNRDRNELPA